MKKFWVTKSSLLFLILIIISSLDLIAMGRLQSKENVAQLFVNELKENGINADINDTGKFYAILCQKIAAKKKANQGGQITSIDLKTLLHQASKDVIPLPKSAAEQETYLKYMVKTIYKVIFDSISTDVAKAIDEAIEGCPFDVTFAVSISNKITKISSYIMTNEDDKIFKKFLWVLREIRRNTTVKPDKLDRIIENIRKLYVD